jgi:hypothetical protein
MYAVIGRVKIKPGHGEDLIQHPFVVRHRGTRQVAEVTFNSLGDMPEAPAVYVSVGVSGVVGEA